jgi:hypothetical protein
LRCGFAAVPAVDEVDVLAEAENFYADHPDLDFSSWRGGFAGPEEAC